MIDTKWIDKNGLLKPRIDREDSGNGVLYSMIYLVLSARVKGINDDEYLHFEDAINKCMKAPGLLMRTPDNKYGQESHDNNLGLAVGQAVMGNRDFATAFIKHGAENNLFFDTDGMFSLADFMGRFPHEILLIHELAYPTHSPLIREGLSRASAMMPLNKEDPSGFHLSWLFHVGCSIMGVGKEPHEKMLKYEAGLKETMPKYFGEGCPILELVKQLKDPVISESQSV